jgi:hypothetical protein
VRDLIVPLFFNDNTELHNLILLRRLILPYLTDSFHSSFIEEYAGGLLMVLQKPDGGIRPILCGEVWRRCFANLAVNTTPIHNEEAKLFTSSYDNFIQTAGIRDGVSYYAKILSVFYDNLDTSDPNDPDVIIKIDVSNAFNTTDRALTLDMISGRTSRDYACGIKEGDVIGTVDSLTNLFGYFKVMRTCHSKLRYFDWDGQVHLPRDKTGGQEGDPLEMLIFNLTIHHLWDRVLTKFQEARTITYDDDGYIKAKLSITLQVLEELKSVFKSDSGLDLNVSKTSILPAKGVTQQVAFDVAQDIITASPDLTHLSDDLGLATFCPEGFIGIGEPIGSDSFVQSFVTKKCRDTIDDVEKLDDIQDGFIHFQLIRFCQDTRFQYINSHIMLGNRCVLQQQHVDCKIADALLKKGTKPYADGWDTSSKDWTHMVLQLPHTEGGFGVPFNCVTKDTAFYTTTSRFVSWFGTFPQKRQELWLPKDDLRDSSSWSSPPLVLLRDIHSKLIDPYDCKEEVCAQSQSQVNVGVGGGPSPQSQVNIGSGPRPSSQDDGVSHHQESTPLSLPKLNRLIEDSFVWDESSASNTDVTVIPSQFKVTKQILLHWKPFWDLKLKYVGSRQTEQLNLRSQQRVVATVEESVLKTEMTDLESQEEDAPKASPLLQTNELPGTDQASPSG